MGKGRERIQWKNQVVNFVAIIVGIYIAYYLTNLKETSDLRKQEQFYLAGLEHELQSDINSLKGSVDTLRYYRQVLEKLLGHLNTKKGADSVIDEMINALYIQAPFIPQDNTYKTLLSGGMETLQDFELRKDIVELYNQHYGYIKIVDDLVKSQKEDILLPYMMNKARFTSSGIANRELLKENMFINLSFISYYSLVKKIEVDSTAIDRGSELLINIRKQLKK